MNFLDLAKEGVDITITVNEIDGGLQLLFKHKNRFYVKQRFSSNDLIEMCSESAFVENLVCQHAKDLIDAQRNFAIFGTEIKQ